MSYLNFDSKYKSTKKIVDLLKSHLMKNYITFYFHPTTIKENSIVIEFEMVGYDDSLRKYLLGIFDGVEIRIDNLVTYYKLSINKLY